MVIDLYGTSFISASLLSPVSSLARRELLASRREVLQTLTSRRYSPSLAAVGLCRESTCEYHDVGRSLGTRMGSMLDQKLDIVLAFPGGRGTADMIARTEQAGVEVVKVGWKT